MAERTDPAIAAQDLSPKIARIGAQLPFVHAPLRAEGLASAGHLQRTPAAERAAILAFRQTAADGQSAGHHALCAHRDFGVEAQYREHKRSHGHGTDECRRGAAGEQTSTTRRWLCTVLLTPRCVLVSFESASSGSPEPLRPRRLAWPRTLPFHGINMGSNPVGDARLNDDDGACVSGLVWLAAVEVVAAQLLQVGACLRR